MIWLGGRPLDKVVSGLVASARVLTNADILASMLPGSAVGVRIDKWLWAVRAFKTRSLAIAACDAGHVKVGEQRVKPSRTVRVGEVLTVQVGEITRTLEVAGLLEKRVGAKVVPEFMTDLTSPEEYAKPREPRLDPLFHRPKGSGRPTKRERRILDRMRGGG